MSDTIQYLLSRIVQTFQDALISADNVQLKASLPDIVDYSSQKFILTCYQGRETIVAPLDERIRGSVILDDGRRFVVNEGGSGSSGSDKSSVFAEIWKGVNRVSRVLIPGHKDVQFGGLFGSPTLSSTGKYVMMVGEPSDPQFPRGFWSENKEGVNPSEKFRYRPDYGETILKYRTPSLVLFDLEKESFHTVNIGGLKIHPAFPTAIPHTDDSLLIVGYSADSSLHTPGLSRCFNRASRIYRIDRPIDDNPIITCLTPGLYLSLAPAVSSDGTRAVFAGHEKYFSAHCTELELFELNPLCGKNSVELRKLDIPKIRNDESLVPTFNGVCLSSQSESGLMRFLPDDRTLLVPSFSSGKSGIFLIDTVTCEVKASVFPPNATELSSATLLGSAGNRVVFVHQGYTTLRTVWMAEIDSGITYTKLVDSPPIDIGKLGYFPNATLSVLQTRNCPAWLLKSGNTAERKPLIAYLHGGPHMMAATQFSVEMANFLAQGYDIVIPNYRGSLSFGKSFLHSLVANAGIIDVADCHDAVIAAKKLLNPSTVIAYGGSHGGFLTAWLLGNPETRDTYSAGVLWNPAVDLVSSNLTSDIPEWALSQVLPDHLCQAEKVFAPSEDFLLKASKQSPMSVVKNVKCPALVLLGSNDKRVVPSAGLRWAQAIESNGGKVDVLWFPDQGHAIPAPEFYETAITSISVWIANKVHQLSARP